MNSVRFVVSLLGAMGIGMSAALVTPAAAAPVTITNAGFETQVLAAQGFTDNSITGWSVYNPVGAFDGTSSMFGALNPSGTTYAPPGGDTGYSSLGAFEGSNVAYTFGPGATGTTGAFGIQQTLAASLTVNTKYTLEVRVGNEAPFTGFAPSNGSSLDLTGFPGYRIELLAGGSVIVSDNNSVSIADGAFGLASITFTALAGDPSLGQTLGIRLINLNGAAAGVPGHQVDFDDVRLDATALSTPSNQTPEPSSLALLGIAAAALAFYARRRQRA